MVRQWLLLAVIAAGSLVLGNVFFMPTAGAEDRETKSGKVVVTLDEVQKTKVLGRTLTAAVGESIEVALEQQGGLRYRWYLVDPCAEQFSDLTHTSEREGPKKDDVKQTGGREQSIWRAKVQNGGVLIFLWGIGSSDPETKRITVADPKMAVVVTVKR